MASSTAAHLNTALTRLRQHTGQDYTLAYNRNLTRHWLRLDGQGVSPKLPATNLTAWIGRYSQEVRHA